MIQQDLVERLNLGLYIMGVTGGIGCGKSYSCEMLTKEAQPVGLNVKQIEMDEIRRGILGNLSGYEKVREAIAYEFGKHLLKRDGTIDRKGLGHVIFKDRDALEEYRRIMDPAMRTELRARISGNQGIVLVDWGPLVEDRMLDAVNYNALLITCEQGIQMGRISYGDLSAEEIMDRVKSQLSPEVKEKKILEAQSKAGRGVFIKFDTTNNPSKAEYAALLEDIAVRLK